jgi:hypothetical protein
MTDDLTQTAFRIADEASVSLVQCNAQRIDAWTYTLTGEEMADEAMDEAVTYLVQRGLAYLSEAGDGWRDCWQRLAPDISTYYLGVLASRLRDDKPITPRLVEQARAEFDATVQRLVDIPPGQVTSAIRTTEIAWEIEKLQRGAAA